MLYHGLVLDLMLLGLVGVSTYLCVPDSEEICHACTLNNTPSKNLSFLFVEPNCCPWQL